MQQWIDLNIRCFDKNGFAVRYDWEILDETKLHSFCLFACLFYFFEPYDFPRREHDMWHLPNFFLSTEPSFPQRAIIEADVPKNTVTLPETAL